MNFKEFDPTRNRKRKKLFGRLQIGLSATELKCKAEVAKFKGESNWESNCNVFPGDMCPILSVDASGERILQLAHWGVRVIVLAQGCFLWTPQPSGYNAVVASCRSQIYSMHPRDESKLMPIAAFSFVETIKTDIDRWPRQRLSFMIVTRPLVKNAQVVPREWATHVKRQPLFLNDDELNDWMKGEIELEKCLDRRFPPKFQKLRIEMPIHVGFWVENPEIRDERVLLTRAQWDLEIETKTTEIDAMKLKKGTGLRTPQKGSSQSSVTLSSSKKRSLTEMKQECEDYLTNDPLLKAAFENEEYTDEESASVPSKRQCTETVASAVSAESIALQRSDSSSSSLVLSDSESADARTNEEVNIKIEDLAS